MVNETMEQFAQELSGRLNRPVRDTTGLNGEYEFEMYWVNDVRELQVVNQACRIRHYFPPRSNSNRD